jgi:hypothetical protein
MMDENVMDIPNMYTGDVALYWQARVAHRTLLGKSLSMGPLLRRTTISCSTDKYPRRTPKYAPQVLPYAWRTKRKVRHSYVGLKGHYRRGCQAPASVAHDMVVRHAYDTYP